jgi:phosphomannomutase/phosphoglucomutase
MFFREFYCLDDAILASIKMLQIFSDSEKKVSQIVDELPKYFSSPELRPETTEEKKFEIIKSLKKEFEKMAKEPKNKINKIIDIDGIRVEFEDGWGLARASNTSAVLSMKFEAKTEKRMEEIKKLFMERVGKYL